MTTYEESDYLIRSHNNEEELTGCGATLPCDPRRRLHRFLVLFLICFLSFGSYFCYDNPAALQDVMLNDLNITTSTYMNFYAFYSWPNVFLSCAGGFLIDRVFGIRLGAIIFGTFVLVGQFIFSAGVFAQSIYLMYFARFVFGIGGESLAVAQNTYASSWFTDSELNFIFGLQLSMSRVGSTVNMNTMHKLVDALKQYYPDGATALGYGLLIATVTCIVSLLCALVLAYFDVRAKRILRKNAAATGEVIRLRDIKDFPAAIWLLCAICVSYYVAIFPFVSLGQVLYERKYGMTSDTANIVNSLIYIVSAVASPICGLLIDLSGKNLFWVMAGIILTMGCHALIAFTSNITPFVIVILMGCFYSVLASSLWPMVVFVVPLHQRGTAYGIMQSVQNLGLGVISILAGVIVESYGYLMLEIFFIVWLCAALIFTVLLYLWNIATEGKLNYSGNQRRAQVAAAILEVSDVVN